MGAFPIFSRGVYKHVNKIVQKNIKVLKSLIAHQPTPSSHCPRWFNLIPYLPFTHSPLPLQPQYQLMKAGIWLLTCTMLSLSPFMNAQTDTATMTTWGGCNDPRYSSSRLIERGELTAVCVVLSPPYNWNSTTSFPYQRYMLNLVADEYTSIMIPPETDYESMHVESGVELSFIRKIRIPLGAGGGGGAVKPLFFPVWTAIITVDDGAITGVVWDLACTQCSSGQCLQNMYGEFHSVSARLVTEDCEAPCVKLLCMATSIPFHY